MRNIHNSSMICQRFLDELLKCVQITLEESLNIGGVGTVHIYKISMIGYVFSGAAVLRGKAA